MEAIDICAEFRLLLYRIQVTNSDDLRAPIGLESPPLQETADNPSLCFMKFALSKRHRY
jgi:hypothetical protein